MVSQGTGTQSKSVSCIPHSVLVTVGSLWPTDVTAQLCLVVWLCISWKLVSVSTLIKNLICFGDMQSPQPQVLQSLQRTELLWNRYQPPIGQMTTVLCIQWKNLMKMTWHPQLIWSALHQDLDRQLVKSYLQMSPNLQAPEMVLHLSKFLIASLLILPSETVTDSGA